MQGLSLHARPTWMLRSGLVVMLIIGVGAAWSSLEVQRGHRQSLLIHDYVHALGRVQIDVLQMETGQRGYLITGDDSYLAQYEGRRNTLAAELVDFALLDPVTMGLPAPQPPIAELVADRAAELDRAVSLLRGHRANADQAQMPGTGALSLDKTAMRDEFEKARFDAAAMVSQQTERSVFEAYMTVVLITAGLLLSGGLSAMSVATLRREAAARETVETALRQREAALARSNAELEQFAHIASHDLQEPLRMISSYTQLLHQRYAGKLDSDADEFIGYAVDGTKRMQILINDLLNLSRVTSAANPMETVDLEVALSDTLKDLQIRIEDCGATVTHEPLPMVPADPVQMRQLLLNLIANGMKFQLPEQKPAVNLSATREGDEWRFGVHDNGIGIDARYFKNLFQIFKRLHTREEYPGTGVGLAVCKKIVERHGGRIWVESVLGQGSTFLFTLPAMETTS